MGRRVLPRLLRLGLSAWLITSLVFVFSHQRLTISEERLLDGSEQLSRPSTRSEQTGSQAALRERLGRTGAVFYVTRHANRWYWHGTANQYHRWLRGLARGEWGTSYRDGRPVGELLRPALALTVPLMGLALLLTVGLTLVVGVYLASEQANRARQALLHLVLTGMQATPLFLQALLLLLLLANPDLLNVLPASDESLALRDLGLAGRLILPVACLVLSSLPELALPLAAGLRRELAQPYATTARAKGVPAGRLLWRHALPNTLGPQIGYLAGLVPALLTGAIVVEVLYALPGMGRLLAEAAISQDAPVLVAGVLLAASARLLSQLAADGTQYLLDPRLRK